MSEIDQVSPQTNQYKEDQKMAEKLLSDKLHHWMEFELGEVGLSHHVRKKLIDYIPEWYLARRGVETHTEVNRLDWLRMLDALTRWFSEKCQIEPHWVKDSQEGAFVVSIRNGVNIEREHEYLTKVKREIAEGGKKHNRRNDYKDEYKPNLENIAKNDSITLKMNDVQKILNSMPGDNRRNCLFKIYDKFGIADNISFLKQMYNHNQELCGLVFFRHEVDDVLKYTQSLAIEKQ